MSRDIVLVGHGYWGKNVARNLHGLEKLYGICELNEETLTMLAERYPEARRYTSFDDVLADVAVKGVAICTPAQTHAMLTIRALEAGKDVFVEKPLALEYEDGERMIEVARAHDCILMVGHLLEYHPAVLALEQLVHDGVLGRIQYIYSNRLNLGKFRREENILWSFAPHDIAVILRLLGQKPIEVIATGGTYLQANIADITVTNLLFDHGVRAHIFVSWLHPYKEQRLVVVGSDKMAVFNDRAAPEEKLILYDNGASWNGSIPVARNGGGKPVPYPFSEEPLRREMAHFVHCMASRQQPTTDGPSGLRVLQVLQAAQRSLGMGGSRVPLMHQYISLDSAF